MYGYEPRDKSGPMDVDSHDPMARLAQYALPTDDEGPARKRPHSDLSTFPHTPTRQQHLTYSQNTTPFMFHTANLHLASPSTAAKPFKPYDPSEWARNDFGFGPMVPPGGSSGRAAGVEDVEMQTGESPARAVSQQQPNETVPLEATGRNVESRGKGEEEKNKDKGTAEDRQAEGGRPIAGGAVTRVRRRRQKEWRRKGRRGSDTEPDDDDGGDRPSRSGALTAPGQPTKSEHHYSFHMPPPALRHSEIPALLLGYLQFFVNASVVVFVLYLAVQFVLTVRRDVKDRMQEVSVEILQEIAECSHLYLTNRCDPSLRVPAMEAPCKAWEACMQRDPTMVGRTNVMAETFAGVINSFVDPISWKTMSFTLVTLSFLIILTNSALFNLRARASHHPDPPQAPHHTAWPGGPQPPFLQPPHRQSYPPPPGYPAAGPGSGQIGWDGADAKTKKGWWG